MSDQRVAFGSKLLQLGILYVIAFIIGVTANGIILYALIFLKRRTVSEVFVLNLVSGTPLVDSKTNTVFLKKKILTDLIYIIGLPFWAVFHFSNKWIFGDVICKFCGGSFYTGMFAMSLFVMLLAFDRTMTIFGTRYNIV